MQLFCPMCSMTITASPPKAGRYTPKCPKCEKPFVVTITVQTVAEYKSANDKARPSSLIKHDPEATFATQASDDVEQDSNSTFSSHIPALSERTLNIDPEATFTSQLGSRPILHDPASTFASQAFNTNDAHDQTEAKGGYLPDAQATNGADKTEAGTVSVKIKSSRISRTSSVIVLVMGVVLAFLGVPFLRLLGVNIPDVGPLQPTHLFAIFGIVTGVLGFFLLGRK